jgi:hypothetical protein
MFRGLYPSFNILSQQNPLFPKFGLFRPLYENVGSHVTNWSHGLQCPFRADTRNHVTLHCFSLGRKQIQFPKRCVLTRNINCPPNISVQVNALKSYILNYSGWRAAATIHFQCDWNIQMNLPKFLISPPPLPLHSFVFSSDRSLEDIFFIDNSLPYSI